MDLEIIGKGKTTNVYRDGDKAIKLYVNAPPNEAHREAKLQMFAVNAGLPVPKVYGVRQLEQGVALEMEYVCGQELVKPRMDAEERRQAFETLVKLQCMVHQVDARGLPGQFDRLEGKIKRASCLDQPAVDILLNRLQTLYRQKNNLCHGDFHALNIVREGEKYWIIDWVDATCGDPFADACQTYLILKQYISRMAGVYLQLFCKQTNAKQEDILVWLPIVAAAHLNEKLNDKERSFLLDIVRKGILEVV